MEIEKKNRTAQHLSCFYSKVTNLKTEQSEAIWIKGNQRTDKEFLRKYPNSVKELKSLYTDKLQRSEYIYYP